MSTKSNVKANTTAKKSTGAEKTTTKKATTTAKTTTAKATEPKQNVKGMLTTLKSLVEKITDKKLKAEVQNSLKIKNPKAEDVAALLKRVIDSGKPAVVENEVKAKKPTIKKTEKAETAKTTAKAEKKTTTKKEESAVKSVQTTGNKKPPIATLFPEKLNIKLDGEDVVARKVGDDEYTSIEDIIKAYNDEATLIIAGFWSKRHIKEYDYALHFNVKKAPKEFPNDLDIAQAVQVSEMNGKLYAMSIFTEAMYVFLEEDFEPVEDTNPYNGEKYNVRVSNGMEFALYVAE